MGKGLSGQVAKKWQMPTTSWKTWVCFLLLLVKISFQIFYYLFICTGVGSLSLLQRIFPTKGLNPGLPNCRQILYQLSHKGSPRILEWVAYPFSRGSSWLRNWTRVSCIAGGFFTNWAIREALLSVYLFIYFWWHCAVWEILVPQLGIKPSLWKWKHWVLTIRAPASSQKF